MTTKYKLVDVDKIEKILKKYEDLLGWATVLTSIIRDVRALLEDAPAGEPMSKSVMKRINVQEGRDVLEAAPCASCNDTGDMHKADGEYLGKCPCVEASPEQESEPVAKKPWPNHNWCVGCAPDNCSGCGTEPRERRTHPPADVEPVANVPTKEGIYVWCNGTQAALTYVSKRPTKHATSGTLNAAVINSSIFYDGCAIDQWGCGYWIAVKKPPEDKVDAERYRWLRDKSEFSSDFRTPRICDLNFAYWISGEALDEAIDEAMKG